MRIGLVGSRYFPARHGGLEVAVEELAREFAAHGDDVDVWVDLGESPGSEGISVHSSPAVRTKHLHTASQVVRSLWTIRRSHIDLVSVHGVGPAFPLAFSRLAFGRRPVFVTCHGLDWKRAKWGRVAKWVFEYVSVRALRRATGVSAVSSTVAAELQALLGREVRYTPNGFREVPPESRDRSSRPDPYAVVISRLTPEKDVGAVIAAWDDDVTSRFGKLVIVGGGGSSYSGAYERSLQKLSQGRAVEFTGALSRANALSICCSANVFISASHIEAQPLAVVEAMSLGVPVVLSDIPQHKELAGEHAQYFSVGDSDALRTTLLSAADVDYLKLGLAGQERVSSMTWSAAASTYMRWFENEQFGAATC